MHVGVPKEVKSQEFRVGVTPGAVREFARDGHLITVETGAGLGIGATDDDYRRSGAQVVASPEEVFAAAQLIIKVKEPQAAECRLLREDHILFTYLHLAADPEQASALRASGCTAIAYETVTDPYGALPLPAPMSEVAGRLSIEAADSALRSYTGGRGLLLGGVPGVQPARVIILGGGVVGTNAARMAVGLGAEVTIVDRSVPRLRFLDDLFKGRVRTITATVDNVERELGSADVVIGAALVPGATAPKLVDYDMLGTLERGTVLVDVSIDQGGCFSTSRATTHEQPTYEIDGVIHYCVVNMPGAVPRTSSYALVNATLPFGLALARDGIAAARKNPHLKAGVNVHRGNITCQAVADSLGSTFTPFAPGS
jgi:alanine dehydrogenase